MSDDNDSNIRRSRRIAAKVDEPKLYDKILEEIDNEISSAESSSTAKKPIAGTSKKKIYRSGQKSAKPVATGTLFDHGLQAVRIIGATSVNDETKGTDDVCYLVKYDNDQFELVLNTVAHKFCPMLVIDFLESRINFHEKDDYDLSQELFGEGSSLANLGEITDSQPLNQMDHSSQSIEI